MHFPTVAIVQKWALLSLRGKRFILGKNGYQESIQRVKTTLCRHPICIYCLNCEFSHFYTVKIVQKWVWSSLHRKRLSLSKNWHRESIQTVKLPLFRHPICIYCLSWDFSHFYIVKIVQKWVWSSLKGKRLILSKNWHRESIQRV